MELQENKTEKTQEATLSSSQNNTGPIRSMPSLTYIGLMSLYNLWWYEFLSNQFQHSFLRLRGLNSHLIWIDFFGNLSSWLRVPPHTNTKSRPFSSPFTSFCETVIFPTPGSFPWGWIALIQSTFPCSSILLLDLPVCSPLLFPVVSCFPSSTVSKHDPSAPALILSMLKGEEGPLCMSCKDTGTDSKREKTSPLHWAHVNTCTQWSHRCMHKYTVSVKNWTANLNTDTKEWTTLLTLQHHAYYTTFRACTSFSQHWAGSHTSSPQASSAVYSPSSVQLLSSPCS